MSSYSNYQSYNHTNLIKSDKNASQMANLSHPRGSHCRDHIFGDGMPSYSNVATCQSSPKTTKLYLLNNASLPVLTQQQTIINNKNTITSPDSSTSFKSCIALCHCPARAHALTVAPQSTESLPMFSSTFTSSQSLRFVNRDFFWSKKKSATKKNDLLLNLLKSWKCSVKQRLLNLS